MTPDTAYKIPVAILSAFCIHYFKAPLLPIIRITMLNSKDINNRIKAKDQRTLFSTVPIIVFPIPIVKILVSVEAGVVKLVGITAAFPITI